MLGFEPKRQNQWKKTSLWIGFSLWKANKSECYLPTHVKPHIFSGRNRLLDRRDARLRAGVGEVGEEKKQEEGAVVVCTYRPQPAETAQQIWMTRFSHLSLKFECIQTINMQKHQWFYLNWAFSILICFFYFVSRKVSKTSFTSVYLSGGSQQTVSTCFISTLLFLDGQIVAETAAE